VGLPSLHGPLDSLLVQRDQRRIVASASPTDASRFYYERSLTIEDTWNSAALQGANGQGASLTGKSGESLAG